MNGSQRTNHHFRERARARAHLVIERHGSECYYCGAPLVQIKKLHHTQLIKVTGRHVSWIKDGVVRQDLFLTLDHLVPVSEGGSNSLNNLVPACSKCNNARNRTGPRNPPAEANQSCICPKCGRQKPPKRNKCRDCRAGLFGARHARTQLGPLLKEALRKSVLIADPQPS